MNAKRTNKDKIYLDTVVSSGLGLDNTLKITGKAFSEAQGKLTKITFSWHSDW